MKKKKDEKVVLYIHPFEVELKFVDKVITNGKDDWLMNCDTLNNILYLKKDMDNQYTYIEIIRGIIAFINNFHKIKIFNNLDRMTGIIASFFIQNTRFINMVDNKWIIPDEFKTNGFDYKIQIKQYASSEGKINNLGTIDYDNRIITLQDINNKDMQKETLLHEIIHGLDYISNGFSNTKELKERQIFVLSKALYGFIKHNKAFLESIIELTKGAD